MSHRSAQDLNRWYVIQSIQAAANGDAAAAEEVLSLFRGAVDSRQIDGVTPEHRKLAEYVAEAFWKYSEGRDIAGALGIRPTRGVGQPKGSTKVNQDSYAALMILLARKLGSANKAKDNILQYEQGRSGKGVVSRRTLDTIYASYAPAREFDHGVLVVMLSPAHRKLFSKSLR